MPLTASPRIKHRIIALTFPMLLLQACSSDKSIASLKTVATETDGVAPDAQKMAKDQCDAGEPVHGRKLKVVTTVAPITSIVANIAGGRVDVIGVVPEGTSSHTFEPSPNVAETFTSADVLFVNGLSLEDPTQELAATNLPKRATTCELGTTILPVADYAYDFSFPKDGGKPNPHLWTNPPMAKAYAQIVADVLSRRDPDNALTYANNLQTFTTKIDALDAAFRSASETVKKSNRALLTYHDAYAYFAKNYDWKIIGAIQPSSFNEPTPKDVADLITQIKKIGVPAIFGSEVFPSPVLKQIGKEAGVRYVDVLRDDDLPGTPGEVGHSWLGLMKFDYVTIVEALGGEATALKALDTSDVTKDSAAYPQ